MIKIRNIKSFVLGNETFLICVIIILAFVLRLYKIDNPIADWHSFRQADTASVTRVYLEEGINLLIPRYHDVSSTQSGLYNPNGYRFVEFPIFNLLHLLLYRGVPFVGFDVAGRLTSVLASCISVLMMYLIGKRFLNSKIAVLASVLYAFMPYNVYFTRVVLPEPLGVAVGLLGIFIFIKFIETEKLRWLIISTIFFAISILIKPYLLFYVSPCLYLFIKKYGFRKTLRDYRPYLFVVFIILPFVFWRLWMSQYPEGIPFWKWTMNGDGIRFKPSFWKWIFGERLTVMILGYWGLVPFVTGLKNLGRKYLFFTVFLFSALIYISVFATANVRHDYYQTIIIPPIVYALALGVYQMWQSGKIFLDKDKIVLIFSLGVMFLTGTIYIKDFYHVNHWEIVEAGKAVDKLVPKNDLVIAPYNGDTAFLYQTKRKGWPVVDLPIEYLIQRGAKYFVSVDLNHYQTVEFSKRFPIVERTDRYVILKLQ